MGYFYQYLSNGLVRLWIQSNVQCSTFDSFEKHSFTFKKLLVSWCCFSECLFRPKYVLLNLLSFFLLLSRAKAKDFLKYSCVCSFFLWLCEIPVYIHFFDLTTRGSLLEEPQHDEWWFKSLFLLIYQIPFLWSTILKCKQQISVY